MKNLGKFLAAAAAVTAGAAAVVYYFVKKQEKELSEEDFDEFDDFDDDLDEEPDSAPVTREYVTLNKAPQSTDSQNTDTPVSGEAPASDPAEEAKEAEEVLVDDGPSGDTIVEEI